MTRRFPNCYLKTLLALVRTKHGIPRRDNILLHSVVSVLRKTLALAPSQLRERLSFDRAVIAISPGALGPTEIPSSNMESSDSPASLPQLQDQRTAATGKCARSSKPRRRKPGRAQLDCTADRANSSRCSCACHKLVIMFVKLLTNWIKCWSGSGTASASTGRGPQSEDKTRHGIHFLPEAAAIRHEGLGAMGGKLKRASKQSPLIACSLIQLSNMPKIHAWQPPSLI